MTHIITGGSVRLKDGIKAAEQYAPNREAEVTLHFGTPDAETDVSEHIEAVTALAQHHLHRLLGKTPPAAPAPAAPVARGPGRPKKDTAPAPAAPVDELDAAEQAAKPAQTFAEAKQDLIDEDFDAPIPPKLKNITPGKEPITDAELNAAVQKKNAEIARPDKIRELIATFNPDPTKQFQLRQIAQDQRDSFIAQLADLTK